MSATKRIRAKLGSIVAIPLGNGQRAFARIYRDGEFGVFDIVSQRELGPNEILATPISFFQNAVDDAVRDGSWPIIAEVPFASHEDEWAPAKATWYSTETREWTTGQPMVSHKGQTRTATTEEVGGMDVLSVCGSPSRMVQIIIDRLVNGNHRKYRVE